MRVAANGKNFSRGSRGEHRSDRCCLQWHRRPPAHYHSDEIRVIRVIGGLRSTSVRSVLSVYSVALEVIRGIRVIRGLRSTSVRTVFSVALEVMRGIRVISGLRSTSAHRWNPWLLKN